MGHNFVEFRGVMFCIAVIKAITVVVVWAVDNLHGHVMVLVCLW